MSVKFGVIYNPPSATKCALDSTCSQRGALIDSTLMLCRTLRLNCTFLLFNGTEYGDVDDSGKGTGLIGAIQKGQFDASLPYFTPTFRRFKAVQFSSVYDIDEIILMTRAPEDAANQKGIFEFDWSVVLSFHFKVWIAFALTLISASCILVLAAKKLHFKNNSFTNLLLDIIISLITNEFKLSFLRFDTIRVIVAAWTLSAVILTSAYTGVLFSEKISSKPKAPFTDLNTFVDCLEKKQCRIIASTTSSSFLQQLTTPGNSLGTRMADSLVVNPILVMPVDNISKAILEEKEKYLVNIGGKNSRLYLIRGNRGCLYRITSLGLTEVNAFPLAKNTTRTNLKTLNKMTLAFREFGLGQKISKTYLNTYVCDSDSATGNQTRNLFQNGQFLAMSTTFCFYVFGVLIGFIVLLLELMVFKK